MFECDSAKFVLNRYRNYIHIYIAYVINGLIIDTFLYIGILYLELNHEKNLVGYIKHESKSVAGTEPRLKAGPRPRPLAFTSPVPMTACRRILLLHWSGTRAPRVGTP